MNATAELKGEFNATLNTEVVLEQEEATLRIPARAARRVKRASVILEAAAVLHRHSAGFDNVFAIASDVADLGWDVIETTDLEERLVYDLASEDIERWEMLQEELDQIRGAIGQPDDTDEARWEAVQAELTILRNALATTSPEVDPGDLVAIFEIALL